MPRSTSSVKSSVAAASSKSFSIADAKTHFSEVISGVERRRQPVTILRRGQPVAQIIPMQHKAPALYGSMRGSVIELGDIVGPTGEEWTIGDE